MTGLLKHDSNQECPLLYQSRTQFDASAILDLTKTIRLDLAHIRFRVIIQRFCRNLCLYVHASIFTLGRCYCNP